MVTRGKRRGAKTLKNELSERTQPQGRLACPEYVEGSKSLKV